MNKQLLVSGFNLFHQIDFSDSTRRFGFENFSPLKKNELSSSPSMAMTLNNSRSSLMSMMYGENIVNACGSLFYNMYLTNFGRLFVLGNFHITDHEYVEFQKESNNGFFLDDSARDFDNRMIVATTSYKRFYELSNHSSLIDSKIVQMACGRDFSLLLTQEGTVLAFGNNMNNQCAFPLSKTLSGRAYFPNQIQSPVQVLSRAVSVSCGQKHSIVLMNDRKTLITFGDNSYGQLGIGHLDSDPDRHFISLGEYMDSDDYIEKIECGGFHNIVLTRKGTVILFGRGIEGQLGLKHSSSISKPTILNTFRENNLKVKSVACGEMHTLFLTYCGQVFACGSNYKGELGLGKHNSLVQHVTEPTKINFEKSIETISCGSCHSLAVSRDGSHFAFGQNQEGQLAMKGGNRFEFLPKNISIESTEHLSTSSLFSNSSCFCSFLVRGTANTRLTEFFTKLTTSLNSHKAFADCTFTFEE
ncbi:predicted protein [Naegleria gruberi]|uniref:Predicted protein n=1 Tax=Naegleria gruberi TaxID=5762 RepID=D2V7J6_NAEGR|nr:uncharacterized protein NAEGRDRAFT_64827 [Naegleria gruberi]EFC47263.1 predicted protein [Naegleria gruberi]|eukprot:XP_002680007.1 predicted protein [Naegleria gruberi strain NEG-M]